MDFDLPSNGGCRRAHIPPAYWSLKIIPAMYACCVLPSTNTPAGTRFKCSQTASRRCNSLCTSGKDPQCSRALSSWTCTCRNIAALKCWPPFGKVRRSVISLWLYSRAGVPQLRNSRLSISALVSAETNHSTWMNGSPLLAKYWICVKDSGQPINVEALTKLDYLSKCRARFSFLLQLLYGFVPVFFR